MTGFGLLGHLRSLAAASGVAAAIAHDRVPMLAPARDYVREGIAPGGTHANRRFLSHWVTYDPDITEYEQLLLCDAQTSGGLLAAVSADQAEAVLGELRSAGGDPDRRHRLDHGWRAGPDSGSPALARSRSHNQAGVARGKFACESCGLVARQGTVVRAFSPLVGGGKDSALTESAQRKSGGMQSGATPTLHHRTAMQPGRLSLGRSPPGGRLCTAWPP